MMNVDKFHPRAEASAKQTGFINSLCRQTNSDLEQVLAKLWGMSCSAAFSDRPWMRLTKREASKVIDHLLEVKRLCEQEEARESYKDALYTHSEDTACPF